MSTISTGPRHSAAVSIKKELYTWGGEQGGRLGLDSDYCKKAEREPILVQYLKNELEKNRENMQNNKG